MRTLQDQKITFHTIRQLVSKLFSPQNHTTFQQLLKQHTTQDVT